MIVKNIIQIGNPLLSQKSKLVKKIGAKETQKVIANLIDSVRFHNLIGMSASQIGEKLAIFVTEIRPTKYRKLKKDILRVYINSKITWASKKQKTIYEGCGSVANANFFAPVKRSEKIIIEALDEKGEKFKLEAEGMLARVIQHEYDHLQGIEFIEKITDIKKAMSADEYKRKMGLK